MVSGNTIPVGLGSAAGRGFGIVFWGGDGCFFLSAFAKGEGVGELDRVALAVDKI